MAKVSLSSITRGTQIEPLKMIVYGPEGVGKTTFAAGLEAPIFIDTDRGSHRVDVARFKPETFEDVTQAVDVLTNEAHDFKTLVIDTADTLETLLTTYVCDRDKQSSIEAYGYGKGYVVAKDEWKLFIDKLNVLLRKRGMNVVFVGHATIKLFKDPAGMDHDKYEVSVNKHVYPLLRAWSDILGFANYETVVTEDKNTERLKVADTGRRALYTTRERGFDAKSRYSLPAKIPFSASDFMTHYRHALENSVQDLKDKIELTLAAMPIDMKNNMEMKVRQAVSDAGQSAIMLEKCLARLVELSKGE